ncbi:MAG TPA: M67 family metallopeptidase [Candidatus Saccharimonadales bacterium]|nr:M67 family metallopeptidase [Candidatus Saccharimonadales bacterium]
MTDHLELPAALRDAIVSHARAEVPKEACGLVAGRDGRATRVIRCVNAHPAAVTRYTIDPREQLRAFRDMEANGEDLVAIYHSHPATQAYPSPTDRAESHYPEAIYVLVSLRDAAPDVRAFRIRDGWVREVDLA